MLDYLVKYHGDETREKLIQLGLSPKQMTAFQIAATMKATKSGPNVWRAFVQCFKTYTGLRRPMFTVSEEAWRRLGTDHGEIEHGTWTYDKKDGKRAEKVPWWTMDPSSELELRLSDYANTAEDFHPDQIDFIHSIYSGDHGKGKLRFGAKLVIGLKEGNEKAVSVYPLADVKCKKDTGEVLI